MKDSFYISKLRSSSPVYKY